MKILGKDKCWFEAVMVAEGENIPITGAYDSLWYLVDKILAEKRSVNGTFKDGDIPEELLKIIIKVLRGHWELNH